MLFINFKFQTINCFDQTGRQSERQLGIIKSDHFLAIIIPVIFVFVLFVYVQIELDLDSYLLVFPNVHFGGWRIIE